MHWKCEVGSLAYRRVKWATTEAEILSEERTKSGNNSGYLLNSGAVMVELNLKMNTGSVRINFVDHTYGPEAATAHTQIDDVVVLQSLTFDLRARVKQVGGMNYVGRITDCPVEEYLGEEIGFGEGRIHGRNRPATA